MSVEAIRIERERREAVASQRAAEIPDFWKGELYASGNSVVGRYPEGCLPRGEILVTCETHWDACLVLLAYGKDK